MKKMMILAMMMERGITYIYFTCKPCKAKILAEMKYIEKLQ